VLKLLAEEVDVDERGGMAKSSPLQTAVTRGHADIFVSLLEHGADVSTKNIYGWTSLHSAAYQGHQEMVRVLLDRGAEVQSKTNAGVTPEGYATMHWNLHQPRTIEMVMMIRKAVCQTRCVAFAMGHQERLGAVSRVRWLDAGVIQMVLEHWETTVSPLRHLMDEV
jgi:hypothetical protein